MGRLSGSATRRAEAASSAWRVIVNEGVIATDDKASDIRRIDKGSTPSYVSEPLRSDSLRRYPHHEARKVPHFRLRRISAADSAQLGLTAKKRISGMIGAVARKLFGSSNDRRDQGLPAARRRDQRAGAGAREAVRRRRCGPAPTNSRSSSPTARRSTTFWSRPSPPCARPPSAPSASAISTCS